MSRDRCRLELGERHLVELRASIAETPRRTRRGNRRPSALPLRIALCACAPSCLPALSNFALVEVFACALLLSSLRTCRWQSLRSPTKARTSALPFAAVDAQTRVRLQDELSRIWAKTSLTVLFITHDIGEAIILGDRIGRRRFDPRSGARSRRACSASWSCGSRLGPTGRTTHRGASRIRPAIKLQSDFCRDTRRKHPTAIQKLVLQSEWASSLPAARVCKLAAVREDEACEDYITYPGMAPICAAATTPALGIRA